MQQLSPRQKWTRLQKGLVTTAVLLLISLISYGIYEVTTFNRNFHRIAVFRQSLDIISANKQLQSLLGSPISINPLPGEPRDFVSINNGLYVIRVQGSKEAALLEIMATHEHDFWEITSIYVVMIRTGEKIELKKVPLIQAA